MSYPPFVEGWSYCVKCGEHSDLRSVRYRALNYTVAGKAIDEHLERTCIRCGYEWKEACLDGSRSE